MRRVAAARAVDMLSSSTAKEQQWQNEQVALVRTARALGGDNRHTRGSFFHREMGNRLSRPENTKTIYQGNGGAKF